MPGSFLSQLPVLAFHQGSNAPMWTSALVIVSLAMLLPPSRLPGSGGRSTFRPLEPFLPLPAALEAELMAGAGPRARSLRSEAEGLPVLSAVVSRFARCRASLPDTTSEPEGGVMEA